MTIHGKQREEDGCPLIGSFPQMMMPKKVVIAMIDCAIRPIVPDDAEAIAMLWLLCTAEFAENEPIYSPNVSAEALAEKLRAEFNAGVRFLDLAVSTE